MKFVKVEIIIMKQLEQKKLFLQLFESTILAAAISLIVSLPGFAEEIVYGANESRPYWTNEKQNNGMCGEILHAMSKAVGLTAKIEFSPLRRLIDDDTNNDLGNPNFYMKSQSFASIIPIAIYKASLIYYQPHHQQPIEIKMLEDLKGYKVGILKGTMAEQSYFEHSGIDFETSYSQDSLIKKMKLGRIDLSLEIELVAKTSILKYFPEEIENFKFIEINDADSAIALMIAEDQPDAMEISNKLRAGLKAIIKNGTYKKIVEKYYGAGNIPNNWFDDLEKFRSLYNFQG